MNHIVRIQKENCTLRRQIAAVDAAVHDVRLHLATPKFAGYDVDGTSKAWIATADVERLLQTISDAAADAGVAC